MLTLIRCLHHLRVTAVTRKRPGHSAKSAGGRLHLNTRAPLTHQSRSGLTELSRHGVGTYQKNELARNWPGNTHPQSPQLDEPLWTDPGLKSGIGALELISTLKKTQTNRKREMIRRTFPHNLCTREVTTTIIVNGSVALCSRLSCSLIQQCIVNSLALHLNSNACSQRFSWYL